MNILILNWKDIKHPDVGGAELIAHYFARNLVKDGHKATIFCQGFTGGKAYEHIDGIRIVRRGSRLSIFWHAFRYYRTLGKKPDIVLEMINTIGWQTPLYVERGKRVAYLNQLAREVWFWEFPWPVSWAGYLFERLQYLIYKSTRFLCYSESTKADLETYGIPGKNIFTFSLGLDHTRYRPSKKSEHPLMVFVARLVAMKRAHLCIEAMVNVVQAYPKATLSVVGAGPEEHRLKGLVKKLHLSTNVNFVSKDAFFVDRKKKDPKVKLMQKAWVHILPSVKEGWGMVVTESAGCGTPSIVSNVSGLKDSVKDSKTGIVLTKDPNQKELSRAIIGIIRNKKRRDRLSHNAREWSKNFSWERSYSEFKKALFKA